MGDENPIRTLGDYSRPSHEGYRNTIKLPEGNNVAHLRSDTIRLVQNGCSFHELRRTIDQSAGGKLRDLNPKESWAILKDFALYDNESWNDPRDFTKPVKAIVLPQDVPSTSDRRPKLDGISSCFNTTYPKGLVSEFMASQDARLSKFEADFKQQQSKMTNKIDTVLKAITDRIAGTLPSDTVKNPKLGTYLVSSARSYPIVDPQCSPHLSTSINAIKAHFNDAIVEPKQPEEPKPTFEDEFKDLHLNLPVLEVLAHAPIYNAILDKYVENLELGTNGLGDSNPFDTLADLGSCVNIIPLYLFKKLNIKLLEETDHIFGLADGTKSYSVRIVKDVEVYIGKLKLLNDFYVLDMKKDHETSLLVGRGFLATANAIIDCRMAKIAVGEGITRSVFGVKGVDLGEEEAPYWTTLGKRESYKPRPSTDGIGAKPPYYARKDFLDCHLPGEWEISKDVELNPFKDTLVFRRMVEFIGVIPINLKCNMWESENLIEKPIDWNKPPKNEDGAWHAKIKLIDPDGEEFTKTLQSIPTTMKLSEK
ncbi:MAK10-like protein [Tanacetum coccineum]